MSFDCGFHNSFFYQLISFGTERGIPPGKLKIQTLHVVLSAFDVPVQTAVVDHGIRDAGNAAGSGHGQIRGEGAVRSQQVATDKTAEAASCRGHVTLLSEAQVDEMRERLRLHVLWWLWIGTLPGKLLKSKKKGPFNRA